MNIPFLKAVNPAKWSGNERRYLSRILRGENASSLSGSWVSKLENEFSDFCGSTYSIAMNSGTSTLHSILEAKRFPVGSEVIVPALSVIMNTTSVIHANLTPVYADINENDFLIDVEDVERKITDKTVAIVAVSLYGRVPDLKKLRVLCDKHSLLLIEDNAQCVKASRNGIKVGSLADACSWSFEILSICLLVKVEWSQLTSSCSSSSCS